MRQFRSGGARGAMAAAAVAVLALAPAGAAELDLGDIVPGAGGLLLPAPADDLDPEARTLLARATAALQAGDFAGAETLARQVVATAPETGDGWHMLGLALANLGRTDEALAAFDEAAARYRLNAEPLVVKGDLLLTLDRPDAARQAFEAATARDPSNWRGHDGLARVALREGRPDAALEAYARAAEAAPPDVLSPRLNLARAALAQGEPARAAAALADAAAREDAPDALLELAARAELHAGDRASARTLYERLAARGNGPAGQFGLAALDRAELRLDEAEAQLRAARQAFPDTPAVYLELGNHLAATRRYDDALQVYEAGLGVAPGHPALVKAASAAEMRLGRLDAALAHAEALATREGHTAGDLVWLGSLQEMAGRTAAARDSYRAALSLDPENWVALNNLAVLLTEDDAKEAVALAEQARALAPQAPAVADTLGWARLKAGDAEGAAALYEALHDQAPDDPVLSYRLGEVRLAQGRDAEGRALIEAALAADPAFAYADEARAALAGD